MWRHHTATESTLTKSLVINLNTAATMLVLHKCFVSLRSSSVSRLFRCYQSRSTLSRLCTGLNSRPAAAARTGLLSSQDLGSLRYLIPTGRCETSTYRGFSTSPNIRNDTVGQIQSTHYHLVYTCKVPKPMSWRSFNVSLTYNKHISDIILYGLSSWV